MACATCATKSEKLVNLLPGVKICKNTTACNQRRKKIDYDRYGGEDETTTALKNFDVSDSSDNDASTSDQVDSNSSLGTDNSSAS